MPKTSIYILYNAKASIFGKLDYTRRKLTAPADASPCYACDLTHGGLRLNESTQWTDTKSRIANVEIQQLHQDELSEKLRDYIKREHIQLPCVLGQVDQGPLKTLLDAESLKGVSKDHEAFLSALAASGDREGIPITVRKAAESPSAL